MTDDEISPSEYEENKAERTSKLRAVIGKERVENEEEVRTSKGVIIGKGSSINLRNTGFLVLAALIVILLITIVWQAGDTIARAAVGECSVATIAVGYVFRTSVSLQTPLGTD